MSKVYRSVQPGHANRERKMKLRWERAKAAKGQDRLALKREKCKSVAPIPDYGKGG